MSIFKVLEKSSELLFKKLTIYMYFGVNDSFAALQCAARLGPKAVSDEIGAGSSAEVSWVGGELYSRLETS